MTKTMILAFSIQGSYIRKQIRSVLQKHQSLMFFIYVVQNVEHYKQNFVDFGTIFVPNTNTAEKI